MDRIGAEADLRRTLGTLRYLRGLSAQHAAAGRPAAADVVKADSPRPDAHAIPKQEAASAALGQTAKAGAAPEPLPQPTAADGPDRPCSDAQAAARLRWARSGQVCHPCCLQPQHMPWSSAPARSSRVAGALCLSVAEGLCQRSLKCLGSPVRGTSGLSLGSPPGPARHSTRGPACTAGGPGQAELPHLPRAAGRRAHGAAVRAHAVLLLLHAPLRRPGLALQGAPTLGCK